MKYRVLFEQTICDEVTVEASSYEEAVVEAKKQTPASFSATWVAEEENIQKTEEFEYEVIGSCILCKTPIVNREIPNQPWTYGSDPEHRGLACYKCMRRNEPLTSSK